LKFAEKRFRIPQGIPEQKSGKNNHAESMTFSSEEFRWLYMALKKVEFLSFCSLGDLERLMNRLVKKSFSKGSTIVRQGDRGDCLFLLHSGEVSVQIKNGSRTDEVARLKAGDYFGEMALVANEPRTATVVAAEATDAFLLYSAEFRKLLETNADLAKKLDDLIEKRKLSRPLQFGSPAKPSLWASLKRLTGL
jgi:hypothetical protein